jgi:hypothetical protein
MKKILFILFSLTFYSSNSSANCLDVNLYDSKSTIDDVKIVNQGDMATCYAHSLASIYNIDKAASTAEQLHPYWVAFNHKQRFIHWSPRNLNYSLLSWAYADLEKRGVCDIAVVNQKLTQVKRGVAYSDDQLMYALRAFFQEKKLRNISKESVFQKVIDETFEKLKKESVEFEVSWQRAELERIYRAIRSQARGLSFIKFLDRYVFEDCRDLNRPIDESLYSFGRAFETNQTVSMKVEYILAQQKSVAVGYCARKVYARDPATTTDTNAFPRIARAASTKCGAHYSVLVGTRNTGNKCQYLLRNTYGEGFWGDAAIECYCQDKTTGERRNCRKAEGTANLKVLGCWIDSDKMLNNSYDFSYFK